MPVVWWCFFGANLIFTLIFSINWYPAFFRCLCDFLYKIVNPRNRVFDLYGVYLFCGRVGTGKTLSMVRAATRVKKRFPKVKIYANFHCDIADEFITCWEDVLYSENVDSDGVNQGILFLFDEIHLTFDSQSWKDAPANLLEYISLQRHFHKCIFGASQVWSRVNKVIREQSDYVIECRTYFGKRLVRNTKFTQEEYNINGDLKGSGTRRRKHISNRFFFASDNLRSLYNTDEVIGAVKIGVGVTRAEKKAMEMTDSA